MLCAQLLLLDLGLDGGHIRPPFDITLVCQGLLPPPFLRCIPNFVGSSWLCLSTIYLADLVFSWILELLSHHNVVCAGHSFLYHMTKPAWEWYVQKSPEREYLGINGVGCFLRSDLTYRIILMLSTANLHVLWHLFFNDEYNS